MQIIERNSQFYIVGNPGENEAGPYSSWEEAQKVLEELVLELD